MPAGGITCPHWNTGALAARLHPDGDDEGATSGLSLGRAREALPGWRAVESQRQIQRPITDGPGTASNPARL